MRAAAFERAANLIEENADEIWERGEQTRLRRWLVGLPVDVVSSKPRLCVFRAWHLLAGGELDAAERSL